MFYLIYFCLLEFSKKLGEDKATSSKVEQESARNSDEATIELTEEVVLTSMTPR
jgi:hypothetical protein